MILSLRVAHFGHHFKKDSRMSKTAVNTPTPTGIGSSQAAEIFERVSLGEHLSVSGLASEYSITPGKMRSMLTEHFGSRIQFRRGRNGGISVNK